MTESMTLKLLWADLDIIHSQQISVVTHISHTHSSNAERRPVSNPITHTHL